MEPLLVSWKMINVLVFSSSFKSHRTERLEPLERFERLEPPYSPLQSQFLLRLLDVALIGVAFRRRQRLLQYAVPKLDLDVHFQSFERDRAVDREDFILGEIVDAAPRVGLLDAHLADE